MISDRISAKLTEPSLEENMIAAQAGDKAAYEALLFTLTPILRIFFIKQLRRKCPEADDLTQETLISIHKARSTYLPGRPLLPWIFAIARYRLHDYFRRYGRQQKLISKATDSLDRFYENPTDRLALQDEIQSLFEALNDRQKMILMKIKFEGYSVEEVADASGLSISLIKVTVHRAIKLLQKIYGADFSVSGL